MQKKIVILIGIMLQMLCIASETNVSKGEDTTMARINEQTPSYAQYFSWINNTNEGATEAQTLINLDFFQWLHDEYGMKLDIYAFDAGNIDAPEYYGSMDTEKFKTQFPNGFDPIYQKAKSLGGRLGVWLGPDGFGDTPQEEQKRIELLEKLCRDYEFQLFKVDAVCTQLRPEKQDAFIETMKRCRKYSPDLIVLNHRLELGKATPYVTTWLWEGAETYIDVHMSNEQTATHHRAGALSRGLVPDLKRLTEDHGVCLSSCLDYWEDDLILQAFNRGLILAPEIYANPWLLKDEEFPKLARIYNLHRKYRDILVDGKKLSKRHYGPNAVARGDKTTRLVTLRNLTWQPVTYQVKLNSSIGLSRQPMVNVMQYHPTEHFLGQFKYGKTVPVTVLPFRSCLLAVSTEAIAEDVVIEGCDYEIVQNVEGKPIKVKLLADPGSRCDIKLKTSNALASAKLNGRDVSELLDGQTLAVEFEGDKPSQFWHRKLGKLKSTDVPADAEALYEATCFAADNDALEVRSLRRSGPTNIPQVQKARDAFFNQPLFIERGIWDRYAFDGDPSTSFDVCRQWEKYNVDLRGGAFRIDFGEPTNMDKLEIQYRDEQSLAEVKVEVSSDLKSWFTVGATVQPELITCSIDSKKPIRYVRMSLTPEKVQEIKGYHAGQMLCASGWHCSNLFKPYQDKPAVAAWTLSCRIDEAAKGSYLAIPIEGKHGLEGAWAAIRMGDQLIGASDRAVSFPGNVWEYRVTQSEDNYTYYIPVSPDMVGQNIEIVVLAFNSDAVDLSPSAWITAYPIPYEQKELVLERKVDLNHLKSLQEGLAAEFRRLEPQVIKEPEGYLKYPYLIPAGFYSQLWDWDAFFMANHFIAGGKPEYMKYWALTYMENIDEEGYVSGGMTTQGQRKIFGKFAMKPFLSQGVYQYSKAVGDFSWIEPCYDRLVKILEYRKKTQYDETFGLYYWEIAMQSGADNNPAMNYFEQDTRSYVCADASAFQYGELMAQSKIAEHLGKTEDAVKFKQAAEDLKNNLNKYLWNEKDQVYYNVDRETGQQYKRVSYSSFVPLMYKMASPEQGRATIKRYLASEDHMRSPYGYRSLSKQDPDYNNKNIIVPFSNWQGPVWPIANYIYSIGLKHYGFDNEVAWLAETLGTLLLEDIKDCGMMHENYHADTGVPLAPAANHVDKDGKFAGFISWNLCIENVLEGVVDGKWMLLEIEE